MQVAERSQVPASSTILTLGSSLTQATGDIVIVNLGRRALTAWVKCDSWCPAFRAGMEACPDEWIYLGCIPARAPLNCDAFHQRLDQDCELPIVEFTFMELGADLPGSEAPDLTALIPYEADRNYQVLLGSAVVITARKFLR